MIQTILALIKKELYQVIRDNNMLRMIFAMPLIQLLVLGYAINTDVKEIETAVYDFDRSSLSREYIKAKTAGDYFMVMPNDISVLEADRGFKEILSIHVASTLSGMLNAARLGAQDAAGVKVTLFDSQQLTMGLGLLAISAAKEAAAGRTMTEIIALLDERVKRTYILGVLDTLEYLRRSGRVNWAQFGIGTLLRIKPLLHVHMGQVAMPERVRTSKRALARLLELATDPQHSLDCELIFWSAIAAQQRISRNSQHG